MIAGELLVKFLEACRNGRCLTQLHSLSIKTGLTHDALIATKLINCYSQLTPLRTARKLFEETPHRTAYVWSCILKCYCREKRYKETLFLFSRLFSCEKPDLYTVPLVLKACAGLRALDSGKIIHGFVKKSHQIGRDLFVGSALIEVYSKCGKMDDALCVFEEYSVPDTVLWTTMITGYDQNGEPIQALDVFAQMAMRKGVVLDPITLVSVVSACAQMFNLRAGRSVHGYMIRVGFDRELSLLNALLNLYGKTGSVTAAAKLFKKMEEKDVISWGSMISCYAHHGGAREALDLFNKMISRGIEPNTVSLISALQSCEASHDLEMGRRIHKLAVRKALDLDLLVSTALIDMYMNCCSPDEAIEVFEQMPEKDAVCFSALLHGCVQNGRTSKSIDIFHDMLANDLQPDAFDVVKILTACSELGILQQTSCIHGFATKVGLGNNSFVGASLIESYAKCGSLDGSIAVFRRISDRDVVIWSSMFAAYGFHGKGQEALELFKQMIKHSDVRPMISFLSILSACSHSGLVKEGIQIFNLMVDYQLPPNSKHYALVVDLLGRMGELDKALEFTTQLQEPVEANIWGALLGACRIYQNMEIAEIAAKMLLELDPFRAGHYILLSNMYAVDENWVNVAGVRELVKGKQLKKTTGQSVIETRDEAHTFIANDRSHQDSKKIHELLTTLEGTMRVEPNLFSMDTTLYDSNEI
ncbi:UNVERIFIED_CONTAM: putative pentatricopeptide repeat-containing protein [Sesamum angustifolium]|uniref:Pentatricopeptide repeat-containing protein n=1 Tax=Sesamum angustifolium TaxID=2727405 RepID=A0AAW2RNS7_9LAMI